MKMLNFATGQRPKDDIQLLKGSDRKKFTRSLRHLVSRGYDITIFNITIKIVPRIGKVITYFAELKAKQI
jgi:hypothetical protein